MKILQKDLRKLKKKRMLSDYEMEDKVFFQPGDMCCIKLDIPNKPKMVVVRIERSIIKNADKRDYLKGVRCRWFSADLKIQEAVFSTKDLIKL